GHATTDQGEIASGAPPSRRLHASLGQQPVFAKLAAVAVLGELQQELASKRERTVARLQVGPPLHCQPIAVNDRVSVAKLHARLRRSDIGPVVANRRAANEGGLKRLLAIRGVVGEQSAGSRGVSFDPGATVSFQPVSVRVRSVRSHTRLVPAAYLLSWRMVPPPGPPPMGPRAPSPLE